MRSLRPGEESVLVARWGNKTLSIKAGTHTRKIHNVDLILAARPLSVHAIIHVVGRTLTFDHAIPAVHVIEFFVDAKEWAARAPPCPIGTGPSDIFGHHPRLLQLLARGLAYTIAEAGVSFLAARRMC